MTKDGGEVRHSHLIRDSSLEGLYTLGPGMEKPATNAESRQRMKQLLGTAMEFSLTARQRQIIRMRYLEDKGVKEIARELAISIRAVYKTLQVARKKLDKIKIFLKM